MKNTKNTKKKKKQVAYVGERHVHIIEAYGDDYDDRYDDDDYYKLFIYVLTQ